MYLGVQFKMGDHLLPFEQPGFRSSVVVVPSRVLKSSESFLKNTGAWAPPQNNQLRISSPNSKRWAKNPRFSAHLTDEGIKAQRVRRPDQERKKKRL